MQSDHRAPAVIPTERLVERVRIVKDQEEIATFREAGRRLSAIARRLPSFVPAGRRERDVAFELEVAMRDAGFSRPAFDTIVASGPNSALPHARPTDRRLEPGEPTVLDFGGVYDGYCVDLTERSSLGPPGTTCGGCTRRWSRPIRLRSRPFSPARAPARSTLPRVKCLKHMGLGRPSGTVRLTVSASKSTRSHE